MRKGPRVAVVGGGVFGITAAIELARAGYVVNLFDRNRDLMMAASGINQYRLHRGYHYPRSADTALSCQRSEATFRQMYGAAVIDGDHHYYGIATRGSRTSADEFIAFCDRLGLDYEEAWPSIARREPLATCVRVREGLFDPAALRALCLRELAAAGVTVRLNTVATPSSIADYDYRVIAAYAALNEFAGDSPAERDYQFEVCEKPVVRLPPAFARTSLVIMDGPFMCVDPMGSSGLFVLGNVTHAIHHTSVGRLPEVPPDIRPLLNAGVVPCPPFSRVGRFVEAAREFMAGIEDADCVGSMFTIRTVLPNTDATDERPTLVRQVDHRTVAIFSGKIGTCVDAARETLAILSIESAAV